MELIDEEGRVFGVVNVIDLLVVLFILAVVAAGVALVLGSDETETETETVTMTVRAGGVQPYVAENVPVVGQLDDGNVTSIDNRTITPAPVLTTNESGAVLVREHPRLKTVELEVTVEATRSEDGLQYDEQRLRVGKPVGLDLGSVDLRGNITSIESEE